MLIIDGSQGEGGGQILRTALALSLVTGRPFRIENIRAGRPKPGLGRQHLASVLAAKAVGSADVIGAELGSQRLEFQPGKVVPGSYRFAVGTAGSATLVLQTVLPPLLLAGDVTTLEIEGGTHNPFAPPAEFIAHSYLPLLAGLGPRFHFELLRPGFYPAGGGQLRLRIEPVAQLGSLQRLERGEPRSRRATAWLSRLPASIGERELGTVRAELGWSPSECRIEAVSQAPGAGNALIVEIETEHITAVFVGFGERGKSAESVAREACQAARRWLESGVPVDEHLADQLLLPLALGGGGVFRTTTPSQHFITNADIIRRFLDVEIRAEPETGGAATLCRVQPMGSHIDI